MKVADDINEAAKQESRTYIDGSGGIPKLVIRKTKAKANFVTDDLYLEARGWTIEEAKIGLDYLLDKIKKLR